MISDAELVQGVLNGSINSKTLGEVMEPRIKRLCKRVASKVGCDEDDLIQEIWLILIDKIFPQYKPPYELNGYIYSYVKHIAMHMRGVSNRESSIEVMRLPDGDESFNLIIDELVGSTEIDEAGIFSKIAGEKLLSMSLEDVDTFSRLPEISEKLGDASFSKNDIVTEMTKFGFGSDVKLLDLQRCAELIEENGKKKYGREKKRNHDGMSEEQKELREIRVSMGKTKAEFSEALGIRVSSLDSYEYGVTKKVPVDVMKNARLMFQNYSDEYAVVKKLFAGMKMSHIVKFWAKMLKIEPDDRDALAICLRTTPTTIARWLRDESMPRIKKIGDLHEQVLLLEKIRLAN